MIQAIDERNKRANATVSVNIEQHDKPPVFPGAPYTPAAVSENLAINTRVYTIQAKDDDLKVMTLGSYHILISRSA